MALSQDRVAILLPLAVGAMLSLCVIVIHALAVTAIVQFLRRELRLGRTGKGFWRDLIIIVQVTLLVLIAHILEGAVWALVFLECGQFVDFAAAFYHSAENYTTLGYGDVVMSYSWRLLGPLEAANGMLMFGVSTAVIFAVIQRLVQDRFADFAS